MKTHLPHLLRKALMASFSTAIAGIACADITDGLQWAESFDGSGKVADKAATFTYNNALYEENGVGIAGGDHSNSRIWTTNLSGGNFTDEFTFSLKLVSFNGGNWSDALSLYSNNTTSGTSNSIQLQKNANNELMVYTSGFTGSDVTNDASNFCFGSLDALTGKVLTLTYDGSVLTGYVDDTAIADTVTFTYADGVTPSKALTGFQIGAAFGNAHVSNSVSVDDIAVWNRALSADEITAYLNPGGTPPVTPPAADPTIESGAAYWTAASGNGTWSGHSWSADETGTPIKLGTAWKNTAVFTGDASATVTVDTAAVVTGMSISNGAYTFTAENGGTLTVEDTLTIGENGSATLNTGVTVKNITLAAASSGISFNQAPTITQGGKLTATQGGTITNGTGAALAFTGATLGGTAPTTRATTGTGLSLVGAFALTNTTLTGQIDLSNGTLTLAGTTTLDTAAMGNLLSTSTDYFTAAGTWATNGYATTTRHGKLFSDDAKVTLAAGHAYQDTAGTSLNISYDAANDTYIISSADGIGTEYVAADANQAVTYDAGSEFARATALVLDGGSIQLAEDLADGLNIRADQDGTIGIGRNVTLAQDSVETNGKTVTVQGDKGAVYDMGTATNITVAGLTDSRTWAGTVLTSSGNITSIAALGNARSTVKLSGSATTVRSIKAGSVGKLIAPQHITLTEGLSLVNDADFSAGLTLGTATTAATLHAGKITLESLTIAHKDSSLTAGAIENDSLDIVVDKSLIPTMGGRSIITVTNGEIPYNLTLNGSSELSSTEYGARYFSDLNWEGNQLVVRVETNPDYVKQRVNVSSGNALAGASLLDSALISIDPQANTPGSKLATALNAVDAGTMDEETLTAIAGASTAVLGTALNGDLDRQLMAIRNRTTIMGMNQEVVHHDMPFFNAWINAESNSSELTDSGSESGYKLSSWGGTVGFDADLTPSLTAGLALTAMYGDLDVTGHDTATGDMDTLYLSAFARYSAKGWTHTFVATAGTADISLSRTVMGESLEGETDGQSFGLMYEVGRVIALNEDATACLQPIFNVTWRHSKVDGYTEKGGDFALEADSQTYNTLTFGLGARLQAVTGENNYNRTCLFECRALAKLTTGDTRGSSEVSLAGSSAEVESAEMGALGLEAGAGFTVPVGAEGGSIFIDASIEVRSDYTNANATAGYRINF